MRTSIVIGIVVVIVIIIGGIFWAMEGTTVQPTQVTTTVSSAIPQTISIATNDTLGSYLQASNGMTLYTYASDTVGSSTCSGDCAATWPPYTVASADGLTADANATGTLGTITRDDGTLQVTYNGMPLYFYSLDVNPGDSNGNGVSGVWTLAHP